MDYVFEVKFHTGSDSVTITARTEKAEEVTVSFCCDEETYVRLRRAFTTLEHHVLFKANPREV